MIIYNPEDIMEERIEECNLILSSLPHKYCFITGSFLYKKNYKDIDIFVITRSKKYITPKDKRINIIQIDFNDLYSLFYHSASKCCISKNILPKRPIKATIADYWSVINEAIPTILNQKNKFHKDIRFLILYTEYFKNNRVLSTHELRERIAQFKNHKAILSYINTEIPKAIKNKVHWPYIKRYFYTQAAYYKNTLSYTSQEILYNLTHTIIREAKT